METKPPRRRIFLLRIGTIALCAAAVIGYLASGPEISVQALLSKSPNNPIAAAGLLLSLYAFKSITVVFPIIVLEITAGILFPTGIALAVNFVGLLIVATIQYWIGRFSGTQAIDTIAAKYPKLGWLLDQQQERGAFLCFFLRIISCLPGDMVTMYLGATKVPYGQNLLFGSLGMLPGMVLATLVGQSIQDPRSPMFWISLGLMALLSAASVLAYCLYRRSRRKGGGGN